MIVKMIHIAFNLKPGLSELAPIQLGCGPAGAVRVQEAREMSAVLTQSEHGHPAAVRRCRLTSG